MASKGLSKKPTKSKADDKKRTLDKRHKSTNGISLSQRKTEYKKRDSENGVKKGEKKHEKQVNGTSSHSDDMEFGQTCLANGDVETDDSENEHTSEFPHAHRNGQTDEYKNVLTNGDTSESKNEHTDNHAEESDEDHANQRTDGENDELSPEERMFLEDDRSKSDLFFDDPLMDLDNQGRYPFTPQESSEERSRRAKVIHEILKNFDLEEVMDKYRGTSLNYYSRSLRNRRFQQWLDVNMGNKKIPTSDKKWNERFRQKIMEDYEKREDEKEKKLAEAEEQRVLKLKLQGIIPANEQNKDNEEYDEEGKRRKVKKTRAERRFERRKRRTNEALYKQPVVDLESQMELLNRDESETSGRHRDDGDEDDNKSNKGSENDDKNSDRSSIASHKSEDEDELYARQKRAERKLLNRELDGLYEEETLESLYKEAEKLVKVKTYQKAK